MDDVIDKSGSVMAPLKEVLENKRKGMPIPLALRGASYFLCMDDNCAMLFISYWRDGGKPFPISVRNAKHNIEGCMVIAFTDTDGETIPLLERAVMELGAKVQIKFKV